VIVAVGIAYFVACAAIGWWATTRTRTAEDFFVAGRSIGLLPFAIAAMATTLSGFTFIGGPGLIYTIGFTALFISLPASFTNTMGALVLGKRMRLLGEARRLVTVPDAIGARYRSPAAQGVSAIAILVGLLGYIATNILALGIVVDSIFHVGRGPAIWIGTTVLLAYSAGGGILAGIWTDVFQGLLMAVTSSLIFVAALDAGGGLAAITHALQSSDPALIGPWGTRGAMVALSYFFVFGVGSFGQPHVAHKYYMLKDVRRLKWYPLLMTVAMTLALMLFFSVGFSVRALVATGGLAPLAQADDATPTFLLTQVPRVLAALVFSGVAAAIMSTVSSFLSVGAAALTHDLPRAVGREPSRDDATALSRGRRWTAVLCVLGAILAQASGTLVAFLGIFGYGLFAATTLPALAVGLNWEGATRQGAIASIVSGLVLTLGLELAAWMQLLSLPAGVTVSGLTLVVSLLVFLGVSAATSRHAAGQLDDDVRRVMRA
jgi:Na+/proline symporter